MTATTDQRPIRIIFRSQLYWWACRGSLRWRGLKECSGYGWADSINDAANAARKHIAECLVIAVIAETQR